MPSFMGRAPSATAHPWPVCLCPVASLPLSHSSWPVGREASQTPSLKRKWRRIQARTCSLGSELKSVHCVHRKLNQSLGTKAQDNVCSPALTSRDRGQWASLWAPVMGIVGVEGRGVGERSERPRQSLSKTRKEPPRVWVLTASAGCPQSPGCPGMSPTQHVPEGAPDLTPACCPHGLHRGSSGLVVQARALGGTLDLSASHSCCAVLQEVPTAGMK